MNKKIRFCFIILLLMGTSLSWASLHKSVWAIWAIHNPQSREVISHQEWQDFLSRRVITNDEGINLIDYPSLTEADLETLQQYIDRMSHVKISRYNRNEQLAFWLNLYNALTVQIVAEYYPIDTVQEINISPGLFSIGPWGADLITIENTKLSLDDIHNRIIRAIWNDPRTHYGINDGSIGAANLSEKAFQGATVDSQLQEAAYKHINSLRCVQVIDNKLIVSKIYDWYLDDFGGSIANLINHLSQYANEPLREQLSHIETVNSYIYNWHLNSTVSS